MERNKSAQWALVTGCSEGGIGDAICHALLAAGINVIATARNTSKITSTISSQERAKIVELDVTSTESIAGAAEKTSEITGGKLHYLVNNSGMSYYTPILDTDLDRMRQLYETNVYGPIAVIRAFFPLIKAAKGRVINNTSSGGVDASYLPFGGLYNSSKSAATKVSQTLRLELAPFDIKVITIYAGGVESKIWSNMANDKVNSLDPGSVYQPIREEAEHIMSGEFITNAPSEPWAKDLVARVTAANPPKEVWTGSGARMLWWIDCIAPKFLVDAMFSSMTGLNKMKARLT